MSTFTALYLTRCLVRERQVLQTLDLCFFVFFQVLFLLFICVCYWKPQVINTCRLLDMTKERKKEGRKPMTCQPVVDSNNAVLLNFGCGRNIYKLLILAAETCARSPETHTNTRAYRTFLVGARV